MAAKTDMTPKPPSNNASAVVFGAGPVGAAIALGLQQRGFEVNVYERRSEAAVTADAGRSINLALSTRGRALLNLLGTYDGLESSLVPMRQRRFSNDTYEKYREPLQSINRNLLTVKNIDYAKKAGVKFIYDSSFEPSMVNRNTGEIVFGDGTTQRPKVIVGCDGVNGKVSHLINTDTKRSRKSEWCYMELTIPPRNPKPQGQYLNKDQFENFLIWPGKAPHNTEFIVGLPNQDGSITLTLFALNEKVLIDNDFSKPIITTEEQLKAHLETTYDDQLHEKMEGTTEDGQNWLNLAAKTGFVPIMLNEHDNLAGELVRSADPNFKSQYVFLFGDAALGMEQFLGLAINAGFEGAHRFLEQFDKRLASIEPSDSFWAGQVGARNILNRGVKALQMGSHKNAASMRDGCDDPLGKAIR